jgi:chromosome segregation ATPase
MAQLQERYDEMLKNTQNLFNDATSQADVKIKNLKRDLQETAEGDRVAYQKMITRLNDDTNNLQLKIDEINKGIARFTAQTGLFDKAEQLRKQLDTSIEGLKDKINGFASYEARVINLKNQIDQVQKLSGELDSRISNYNNQKMQLDSLDQKFSRIMALSNSMDQKIAELNSTSDNLVNMQVTIRNFEDSLKGIKSQYDRIEHKAETIEHVAQNVDNTADRIHDLEERLADCHIQLEDMPGQLETLQEGINRIMESNGRINDAVDKLSSLQQILDETEQRIDELNETREGISNVEERLQRLSNNADKQIDLLKDISKTAPKKKSGKAGTAEKTKPSGGGTPPRVREEVRQLKLRKWTNEQIASNLNLSLDAVELILEMSDDDEEEE